MLNQTNNRFFYGFCKNHGNPRSHFNYFIIETVRELRDYNGEKIVETINKMEDYYFDDDRIGDPFYAVYGTLKPEFNRGSVLISTSYDLNKTIDLVQNLTGNYVTETEQPVYRLPDQS